MAESDRAAVRVDEFVIDAEHVGGPHGHGGEGLVDLHAHEIVDTQAGTAESRLDRAGRLLEQGEVGPGDERAALDACERSEAELGGVRLLHEHESRRAVGDL